MILIDELTDWQRGVLAAAGCLKYKGTVFCRAMYTFTKDWNAKQARVALAVLPDGARLTDKDGRIWGNHDRFRYITDEDAPYNIVLPDEPKPEPWTVGTLIAAIEDGREFKISSSGNPRIDPNWFNVRDHELSSANGWTIEEIV